MPEDFIQHTFQGNLIRQRVTDGYINLNQMADAVGRRIDNWLRLQETTSLLREFKSDPQYYGIVPIVTTEGRGGGTWAHPDIAIQFAQWCSPAFTLQVSRWVRQWMTTGQNPLLDRDRVDLRGSLKDDSRLRMTDEVKVYLEKIERYDNTKFRGNFFAQVHDAINEAITSETAKKMRERLSTLVGRTVKQDELIRDYFPSFYLQKYIAMCEASANFMIREGLHPLTAVERASEIVLPVGYVGTPIDFVEHIQFVRQRLQINQTQFDLPES